MTKKTTKIKSKEICEYFLNGHPIPNCAKFFQLNSQTIVNHLKKNNIEYTILKDINVNQNYFDNIDTEYKAYFLGYIVADGNISKTTNRICFCINSDDDYILNELKKDINSKNLIRRRKVYDKRTNKSYNSSTFQINGQTLKSGLLKYGINSNKSNNFLFPDLIPPKMFKHFLRGMFDGDGHISKNRTLVSLISTKEFLNSLNSMFFHNNNQYIQEVTKNANVFRLQIQTSQTILNFLNYLYSDAKVYLIRKYKLYENMKSLIQKTKNITYVREIIATCDENILFFPNSLSAAKYFNTTSSTIFNKKRKNELINGFSLSFGNKTKVEKFFLGLNYFHPPLEYL